MKRVRIVMWLVLALALTGAQTQAAETAAIDPYAAWASGHPQDAIAALHERALSSQRWDAWFDVGLAAAAAGDKGHAAAWLLIAQRHAPERDEPRTALLANGTPLPPTWCDRLGPVAWPGTGVLGIVVLGLAGLALGWAVAGRKHRGLAVSVGLGALLLGTPGVIAVWHDSHAAFAAIVRDTNLLDSAGNPLGPLSAGTVVERDSNATWSGRSVIALPDGRRGLVAAGDVE